MSHLSYDSKKVSQLLLWFRTGVHDIYSSQSGPKLEFGILRDGKLLIPPSLFLSFSEPGDKMLQRKSTRLAAPGRD